MRRKEENSGKKNTQEDMLKKFEQIEYHTDIDLDKFVVDITMNEKLKKQMKEIDEQVEELGKVCDREYKNSYNKFKSVLDKETEEIDNNIKDYISNLRKQLVDYKTRLNYDYKGKFKEISNKVNAEVNLLKKNVAEEKKFEEKQQLLDEDENFFQNQLDNMKDMNIYLKYKLKLLIKDRNKAINSDTTLNEQKQNNPEEENLTYEELEQKRKREQDLLITELPDEAGINNKNENGGFDQEEVNKLAYKLNYLTEKLYYDIENERIKHNKLKNIFDKLYVKTNNIYINILKNTQNDQKLNGSNIYTNNNSSQTINNNQSTLPSIYQSTISSRNLQAENNIRPGRGYMTRLQNKEIVAKFLEKEEIKRIIYRMLYED